MVTREQKIILAGVGAGAVLVGAAVAMGKKGPPPPPGGKFSIALTASSMSVQVRQSVDFAALVSDASGVPQANVAISVWENGSRVQSGVTDAAGNFAFSLAFQSVGTFSIEATSGQLMSNTVQVVVTSVPPPPPPACPSTLQLQLTTGGSGVATLLPPLQAFQLFQAGGCQSGFNQSFWQMWAAGDYSGMPAVYDCGVNSFDDIANIPAVLGCSWGPFTCLPHRYINVCGWTYTSSGTCVT